MNEERDREVAKEMMEKGKEKRDSKTRSKQQW